MKEFFKKIEKLNTKYMIAILIVLIAVVSSLGYYLKTHEEPKDVSYVKFEKWVEQDKVKEVYINLNSPTFTFKLNNKKLYQTDNPKEESFKKYLLVNKIKVAELDSNTKLVIINTISFVIRFALIALILLYIMDKLTRNMGKMDSMKTDEQIPTVKFDKVAGNEEAKEEMQYLVEFLKNPKKYTDKGAKLPKGVVFHGPPGTGKTLLAKAIAGEAEVPFFSISGSDFVEMYVGLGAKRVRELFKTARKNSPCIIFIDEIDAVGTKRGIGNDSEKDQTINALLNDLDGFNGSEGIIVITATNRLDTLDDALIRPGRFDKHIAVKLPDKKDRIEILKVYARNKKMADDISFDELAKLTIGFSGAGLESLINEATILSVTRNHNVITQQDIDDAYFKIVMQGHKKKNQKDRKKDELELVAWHEAGHALVAKLLANQEVPKVTIISSTSGAGGVTFITPNSNPFPSKIDMMNEVKILYAGRIAEFILRGNELMITTGASSDIEQSTAIINDYITKYGMSEKFGLINPTNLNIQPENAILDEAVMISKQLYEETLTFMKKHKEALKLIATALLEKETLTEEELDTILDKYKNNSMS